MRPLLLLRELLFPPKCVLCGSLLEKGSQDLCPACREDAPGYPAGKRKLQFLDSFAAVWYYEGCIRASILRYKFRGARSYAPSYGRLLGMKLLETPGGEAQIVTWVPVHPLKKLRRGYDQSELLARAVAGELELPVRPLLKKVRKNRQQSRITADAERRANVLGAYRAVEPEAFRGKRVLLVDDVVTTGATAGECARVLLTAGAKEVHCAAIASARK